MAGKKPPPLIINSTHLDWDKKLKFRLPFSKTELGPSDSPPFSLEVAPHLPLLDSSRPNPNWCRHFLQSVGGPKKRGTVKPVSLI